MTFALHRDLDRLSSPDRERHFSIFLKWCSDLLSSAAEGLQSEMVRSSVQLCLSMDQQKRLGVYQPLLCHLVQA